MKGTEHSLVIAATVSTSNVFVESEKKVNNLKLNAFIYLTVLFSKTFQVLPKLYL